MLEDKIHFVDGRYEVIHTIAPRQSSVEPAGTATVSTSRQKDPDRVSHDY